MLRLWHNHQYHSRFREKSLRRPGAVIRNCNKGSACRATICSAGRPFAGRPFAGGRPFAERPFAGRPQGSPLPYTERLALSCIVGAGLAPALSAPGRKLYQLAGRPQGSPLPYTERLAGNRISFLHPMSLRITANNNGKY